MKPNKIQFNDKFMLKLINQQFFLQMHSFGIEQNLNRKKFIHILNANIIKWNVDVTTKRLE